MAGVLQTNTVQDQVKESTAPAEDPGWTSFSLPLTACAGHLGNNTKQKNKKKNTRRTTLQTNRKTNAKTKL